MKTKEIRGYNLKSPRYGKAINIILDLNEEPYLRERGFDYDIGFGSGTAVELKREGLLEVFTTPVYKEEPNLEIGKWYKNNEGELACPKNDKFGYGVNHRGIWSEDAMWGFNESKYNWKLASEKEVKEALIKEAKKRGYKNENYKCLFQPNQTETVDSKKGYFRYAEDSLYLQDSGHNGNMIYENGQWAEIINKPTKEELLQELELLKEKISLL